MAAESLEGDRVMSFHRINRLGGVVLAGGLALGVAGAQTQSQTQNNSNPQPQGKSTISDAQIEANVLRQLAGAPELSNQNIQSTTVYGTVTLSGNVHDETLRAKAENLAARAQGVNKVVDELTLGDTPATTAGNNGDAQQQGAPDGGQGAPGADPNNPNQGQPGNNMVLQSDGTYAPAQPDDQGQPAQQQADNGNQPPQPGYDNGGQPNGQPGQPGGQPGYGQPGQPNGQPGYGQPGPPPPPGRQPMYGGNGGNGYAPGGAPNGNPYAGQRAGLQVTVPNGAAVQVRINRGLDSNHVQPGTPFDGIVMNDIVANGAVAIPRGASVQGSVVEAKKAGTLKGRGVLTLQITSLTLGGQTYPLMSNVWAQAGRDKTTGTVNSAIGLGAVGALFGAVAGGGAGAAIGAGVGGAAGIASSAASPNGRVIVQPETVLTFTLAQPTTVTTVSQQEMARLSYAAGPRPGPRYYGPGPYPPPYYRPY
jgi:BON domain